MIVQPDFLEHWKTRMLCDLLDDKSAPIYVIALWAYCQNRKTHRLPSGNPEVTKAICKAPHEAKKFHSAMISAGFIEILDGETVAHEWDSINSYLINSWENGKKGGRPTKRTQTKPTGNPDVTQSEPIREEKRRVDERRERVAHADLVDLVMKCRPEFSRLNPDSIATEIHNAQANPCWRKNLDEFLVDASNAIPCPKNPVSMLRAYLNRLEKIITTPGGSQRIKKPAYVDPCDPHGLKEKDSQNV